MVLQSDGCPPSLRSRFGVPESAKALMACVAQAQGKRQRQRVRGAGLLRFRGYHPDVVGQRARDAFGDGKTGVNPVIVGDENANFFFG